MKKHIIWTSQIDLDDWQDYLQENEMLDEDEDEQYYARTYLQYIAIMGVADEVHDERHSESCNEGVDEIAQASSDSCDEAEPTAFVQRALYAEHSHGSHGRRNDDAYHHSLTAQV